MSISHDQHEARVAAARERFPYHAPFFRQGAEWLWLEEGLVRIEGIESTTVDYHPGRTDDDGLPDVVEWQPVQFMDFILHLRSGRDVRVNAMQIWEDRTFNDLMRAITGEA